ncbi:permease prefix domain 1-containing protein [Effusibacillus consociatus]|uniref:Permease prefix domain 1-containing protein n=1 Tax=Effusibacillus consociatus TaxID=1117041 RepID=A0ABV9Q5T5_9BACL
MQINKEILKGYKNFGNSKEITELKTEMKNHLIDSAKEFQRQGMSEEESVRLYTVT